MTVPGRSRSDVTASGWRSSACHTSVHLARLAACAVLVALVVACGTTRTPRTAGGGYYPGDGPGRGTPPDVSRIADAVPRDEPIRAANSRPYEVFGQRYVPMSKRGPYSETGVASWYGRKFHGQSTATGEPYDMYGMTAAHRTLPLPSYVRVTNLSNRRTVVVRVNDRGPFVKNRIIDLSWTAAKKLDFVDDGHTRVRVDVVGPGDLQGDFDTSLASAPASAPDRVADTRPVAPPRASLPAPVPQAIPATAAPATLAQTAPDVRVAAAPPTVSEAPRVPRGFVLVDRSAPAPEPGLVAVRAPEPASASGPAAVSGFVPVPASAPAPAPASAAAPRPATAAAAPAFEPVSAGPALAAASPATAAPDNRAVASHRRETPPATTEPAPGSRAGASAGATAQLAGASALSAPSSGALYVQLGAFGSHAGAQAVLVQLREQLDWLADTLLLALEDGQFKVRAGPWDDRADAERAAARIRAETGVAAFPVYRLASH